MAAPVVESYSSLVSNSVTSSTFTIDKPAGTADGDLLVLIVTPYYKAAAFTLAGWSEVAQYVPFDRLPIRILAKAATGSEPSNYTFTRSGGSNSSVIAYMLRISSADTSDPIVDWIGQTEDPSSGITTTADNLLICVAANGGASTTFTQPAGMTLGQRQNNNYSSHALAYETPAAGATGTRDWTTSSGVTGQVLFAIAPAAGGGGGTDALTADDVEASSEVTSPAIGQTHGLSANDVESASSLSVPAVGQVHGLSAGGVESASEISTPALGIVHNLLADDVEASSSVGTPTVGQVHALAANDIQSATTVTSPSVGQAHILLANDVASTSEVSAPALAEVTDGVDALLAGDIEAASRVGSPTLGQVHTLTAESIESAAVVSMPTLDRDSGFRQPGGFYPGRNIIYLDKDGNPVDLEEYRRRTANQAIQGAKKAANEAPARNRQEAKRVARSLESAIRANMADAIAAHVRDLQELANVAERARLALAEIERLAEEDDEAAVLMLMAS